MSDWDITEEQWPDPAPVDPSDQSVLIVDDDPSIRSMLGFERQSGRVYPVIEGVVVCREYEALILDAFAAAEAVRHEKALRARAREAARQWQQLLEVMAARQKLEDEFRGPAAPRAAAAPVAAPGPGAPRGDKGKAGAVPGVQTVMHEDGFAMEIEEI